MLNYSAKGYVFRGQGHLYHQLPSYKLVVRYLLGLLSPTSILSCPNSLFANHRAQKKRILSNHRSSPRSQLLLEFFLNFGLRIQIESGKVNL
jgi:hypothetical protein